MTPDMTSIIAIQKVGVIRSFKQNHAQNIVKMGMRLLKSSARLVGQ